jgi:hypothetical protein
MGCCSSDDSWEGSSWTCRPSKRYSPAPDCGLASAEIIGRSATLLGRFHGISGDAFVSHGASSTLNWGCAEKGVAAPDSSNSRGTSNVSRAAVLEAVTTVSFSAETETSLIALWGVATDRSLTID